MASYLILDSLIPPQVHEDALMGGSHVKPNASGLEAGYHNPDAGVFRKFLHAFFAVRRLHLPGQLPVMLASCLASC